MANEDRLARIERSIERLVSALGPPATTAEAEQTKRVQDAAVAAGKAAMAGPGPPRRSSRHRSRALLDR